MSALSSGAERVRTTGPMQRDVVRNVRAGIALAVLMFLGWLGGCSEIGGPDPEPQLEGLIVSDPVSPAGLAAGAGSALALTGSVDDEVTYVSLPPGTVPTGAWATIARVGDGGAIVTAVRDGGFDPVPVAAQAGDSLIIRVTDGGTPLEFRVAVRAARPPIVVRTQPPRKKTDVALNAALVIVFSEPVAEGSLSGSSVRLLRGTVPVAGTVRLLQGSGSAVAFIPATPLAANTSYRLVVSRAVQDLDGDPLAAGVTVSFTTGQSSTGPAAAITVSPDTVRMTGATYQMTATVRDAAGNELIDQPVMWATSDPTGLTVSPTGLLTALAAGSYTVTATVNGLSASVGVFVLAGPAASLEVTPAQGTVGAAGDTIILAALARDEGGLVIPGPGVTWTSSDLAVATVAPWDGVSVGSALGTVTGVSPGSVLIIAMFGSASDTATVTVVPRPSVASVTITPESAMLVVRTTRQLSAAVRDANDKVLGGRLVTWTSDDAAVATVDANGLVTGVSEGAAGVSATSEGVSDTAAITVRPPLPVASVTGAAGGGHTCGLTSGGAAYCWGSNARGQLGISTAWQSAIPVAVSGGLSFVALAAGSAHTCGLTGGGAAYCWGANEGGQLGTGSTTGWGSGISTPVAVAGGLSFVALAAGDRHTCGLTDAGVAYCWGSNSNGELGTGSDTGPEQCGTASSGFLIWCSSTPVAVTGGLSFAAVAAGSAHTCGLTSSGAAYCWGGNAHGELGNGSFTASSIPVAVSGGLSFSAFASGGGHSCGLTSDGAAYCWGWNGSGQLGNGSTTAWDQGIPNPVAVSGGLRFSSVGAGGTHTCGVTVIGVAYCWGWNEYGQLGTGSTTSSSTPAAVSGGLTFSALAAGGAHTCGLTNGGAVYCWGHNYSGQIGNGWTVTRATPAIVSGGVSFGALASAGASANHTCGLTAAGVAYCWGDNLNGQLGTGSTMNSATPVAVSGDLSFTALAAGLGHTCGLTSAGAAYCWGSNGAGQLGDGSTTKSSSPVPVSGGLSFTALAVSPAHTCGLTSAGAAYCWGSNYYGQLGNGSTTISSSPVPVSGGLSFSVIALGWGHTCGVTSAGTYCWGRTGGSGGDWTANPAPYAVPGGLTFTALTASGASTCGLANGGQAYCWQVGSSPGPTGFTFSQIAAGYEHTCGLSNAGAAYCWGNNNLGQLGDGSLASLRFTAIATGYHHTCGLTSAGTAYCWGYNYEGQLGDGMLGRVTVPVAVAPITGSALR